jgi:hypothetical protein
MEPIYSKFRYILSGCNNINDAIYYAKKIIDNHPEYNKLLLSMIYSKTYDIHIDIRTISNILLVLNNTNNKKDIDDFINTNSPNLDLIQLASLMRISKTKDNELDAIHKTNTDINL